MTDNNQKKQDKKNSGINPVVAAVTGVVVGAGAAVATILALKNEKNQKKVKEVLSDVKDYAKKSFDKLEMEPNLKSGTEKIKAVVENKIKN